MGIIEAILEDAKMQGIEIGIKQGIKQVQKEFEQEQKQAILSLQEKGFSDEEIAEILNISVEEILRLTQET